MRWGRIGIAVAVVVAALPGTALPGTAAADTPVRPWSPPPFADECTVHSFGEGEVPDPLGYPEDPLCVEYAKRDITVDNGGAVAFLLAEPARVALAAPKCRYWQQDHWSVQFSRGDVPVLRWDGSYWFDKGTGRAAGRLARLTVGGQRVGVEQAAAIVERVSPELADYLRSYDRRGPGAAVVGDTALDPRCAR
jgi:hypothetical protein